MEFKNTPEMQAQILELAKLMVQEKSPHLDLLKQVDKAAASSTLPLSNDMVAATEIEEVTIQSGSAQRPKG